MSPQGAYLQREDLVRAEAQAAALEAHLEHDHARAQAALDDNARLAFKWAIAGLVLCCIPIPAIVALVMAVRTQAAAKRHDNVVPGRATAALVISVATLALFCGAVALYLVDSLRKESRTRELQDTVERTWTSTVIDQTTGCALTELKLIQDGFEGKSWTSGNRFSCHGKIEQKGERAVLHDGEARIGSGDAARVTACMKRGERWMVEKLVREGGACEPVVTATVASSAPPPHPSAAPSAATPVRNTVPRRK